MVTMKNALVTSGINDEKKEQIIRMVEDGVRKGIKVIGLNDDSGQRVVNRGTELIDTILDKIRELSLELPNLDCFNSADWQTLYRIAVTAKQMGAIGDFPWSDAILNSACPFNKGKMVRETHFAYVGLESTNGESLTINQLQKLNPKATEPRFYSYEDSWYAKEQFAAEQQLELRWHLMLKEIVPGSESKTWDEQRTMLPPEYEVPTAVAETAKDLLIFKKLGVYVNGNRYARTASVGSDGYLVIVGDCGPRGVRVDDRWDDRRDSIFGVGASRKSK
jgi:hypothetical protein